MWGNEVADGGDEKQLLLAGTTGGKSDGNSYGVTPGRYHSRSSRSSCYYRTAYKIQLETLSPTGTKVVLALTYAAFALALILGISGVSSTKRTKVLSAAPCSSALASPGTDVYTGGFAGVDDAFDDTVIQSSRVSCTSYSYPSSFSSPTSSSTSSPSSSSSSSSPSAIHWHGVTRVNNLVGVVILSVLVSLRQTAQPFGREKGRERAIARFDPLRG